ncbi:efflux RND transporter periplasmic adaptor subunit [Thalassotalea hakodatensis]|uniref:efflux RND transporter periplasmic adaptor subunit n=1 Tax=Thalassotalea hakodatensis TaxID=3030492 RepID=UPI0025743080|nr:efflux RND transporter periplasmic adaptor subunit [Thalassotalea hakodatensis]
MKKLKLTFILPLIVIIACVVIAMFIIGNPPQSKRQAPKRVAQLDVDVKTINPTSFTVIIESYGTVKPRTQSILYPQVSGQIVSISEKFQAGGFFEKGDELVRLDDRDLKAEVAIAKSNLLNARQTYSEEQARVEQAKQDWTRLGNNEQAPDLVMRKPQIQAAKANVESAQASLHKAELALERTRIIAPFSGRILSKNVDVGQLVSTGTQLAEIYAIDYVEIRLPLKNKDLPYIDLPENTRLSQAQVQPEVRFESSLVKEQFWQGKVVRTEGAYDVNSQQLYVVAQITDPYGVEVNNGMPIKIGQYVSAEITGKTVEGAITIPNRAIYQGSYVYVVEDNVLIRKEITTTWQNDKVAIIDQGLVEGDLLVLTPLGQVTSGTRVAINERDGQIANSNDKPKRTMKKDGKKGNKLTNQAARKQPQGGEL